MLVIFFKKILTVMSTLNETMFLNIFQKIISDKGQQIIVQKIKGSVFKKALTNTNRISKQSR